MKATIESLMPPGYPKKEHLTTQEAFLPMGVVVHHTTEGILSTDDVYRGLRDGASFRMLWKEGGDGQTGLGEMMTAKTVNDAQLYTRSIVPLFIEYLDSRVKVYANSSPGGARELRPLSKAHMKDTEAAVVATIEMAKAEAAELAATPQVLTVGTKTVTVHHQVIPSMHDGKNIQFVAKSILRERNDPLLKTFCDPQLLDFKYVCGNRHMVFR